MKATSKMLPILLILAQPLLTAITAAVPRALQQTKEDLLDRPVSQFDTRPRSMREIFQLALESARVPGGSAVLFGCEAQEPVAIIPILTPDATVRQALDAIVRANPAYRWELDNGAINLLPAAGEPLLLKTRIPRFHAHGLKSISAAIDQLEQMPEVRQRMADLGLSHGTIYFAGPVNPNPPPAFDVTCDGLSLREVLNEVARRSTGAQYWEYHEAHCGSRNDMVIITLENPAATSGA